MTWILTYTGKRFDPLAPRVEDIDPLDIAHALGNLCRFNGHCNEFYSVADHSVAVVELVDDEYKLDALLHDAAEAYIGDITRPLKRGIDELTGGVLTIIEREIHHCVAERFGISPTMPDQVKHADLIMLATERRDLMPDHGDEWECLANIRPRKERIFTNRPQDAERLWLFWFDKLSKERAA